MENISLVFDKSIVVKEYKDENEMLQKDIDALMEFDGKTRDCIQQECKNNGWKTVYNYQIKSMGTKDWFDMYATYDYE